MQTLSMGWPSVMLYGWTPACLNSLHNGRVIYHIPELSAILRDIGLTWRLPNSLATVRRPEEGQAWVHAGNGVHKEIKLGLARSSILGPLALVHSVALTVKCSVDRRTGAVSITSNGANHFSAHTQNTFESEAAEKNHLNAQNWQSSMLMTKNSIMPAAIATVQSRDCGVASGNWIHPAILDNSLHLATALDIKQSLGTSFSSSIPISVKYSPV